MGQGIETPQSTLVYSTSAKVAALLQVPAFDASSTPKQAEVEDLVRRAEDEVDRRTGHSWRVVKVTNEYHDLYPAEYRFYWSVPRVRLNHFAVKAFSGAAGDKLEVYDAAASPDGYTDWVASKVENRKTGDFYSEYEDGEVYFIRGFPIWRYHRGVRVTYRYGTTDYVPKWVEDVATKIAALDVHENFKQMMYTQEDLAKVPPQDVARSWRDFIERTLDEQAWLLRRRRARLI